MAKEASKSAAERLEGQEVVAGEYRRTCRRRGCGGTQGTEYPNEAALLGPLLNDDLRDDPRWGERRCR
jgi:hypothetical protein